MSREKLTEALLEKRDAEAGRIWQEVEQQVSRYRQKAEERCTKERQELEKRYETLLSQQRDSLDNRTGKRLRRIRLLAEETFFVQLWPLALAQLSIQSAKDRVGTLRQLAAELPELDWQQVTVHPDDRKQAAQLFPGSIVASEPALLGGLIAATSDGAISINNSLIRRLEQLWPKLCGSLLDTLKTEVASVTEEMDDAKTSA